MQVTGRDPTGVIQTPAAVTLTGTTPVTGSQTFERLLSAVITGGAIGSLSNPGGTAAIGDVAVYAHTPVISAHTAQTGSANTSGATPPLFQAPIRRRRQRSDRPAHPHHLRHRRQHHPHDRRYIGLRNRCCRGQPRLDRTKWVASGQY